MGLYDLQTQGAAIKHRISTDHYASQIHLMKQCGGKRDFTSLVLHIHLSQRHALLREVNANTCTPSVSPNGMVPRSVLPSMAKWMLPRGLSSSDGLCKKLPNDLLHLASAHAMTQHAAPGAIVRHTLSFEMEHLT